MKKYWWIFAIIISAFVLYKFRYKLGIVSKVVTSNVPNEFVRQDTIDGNVIGNRKYYKEDGKYYYILDYGIAGGFPQEITLEKYMDAYKS